MQHPHLILRQAQGHNLGKIHLHAQILQALLVHQGEQTRHRVKLLAQEDLKQTEPLRQIHPTLRVMQIQLKVQMIKINRLNPHLVAQTQPQPLQLPQIAQDHLILLETIIIPLEIQTHNLIHRIKQLPLTKHQTRPRPK